MTEKFKKKKVGTKHKYIRVSLFPDNQLNKYLSDDII